MVCLLHRVTLLGNHLYSKLFPPNYIPYKASWFFFVYRIYLHVCIGKSSTHKRESTFRIMAATTTLLVPVSLPGSKIPTKQNVKDILSIFFPAKWSSVDPDSLNLDYHGSFTSPNMHVVKPVADTPQGLSKVFIKFPDVLNRIWPH